MQNGQTEQYRVNIRVVWSKRLISRSRLPGTMHWLPRTNECGTPWRRKSDRALPPQVGVGQRSSRRSLFESEKSPKRHHPSRGMCLPGYSGNLNSIVHSVSKAFAKSDPPCPYRHRPSKLVAMIRRTVRKNGGRMAQRIIVVDVGGTHLKI